MNNVSCPEDEDLLPLVAGDLLVGGISDHVGGCASCQQRVKKLQSEISSLRWAFDSTDPIPVSIGRDEPTPLRANFGRASVPTMPAMIGRYRVLGSLASGGQANVYRVMHPTLLNDLVCKVSLRPCDPVRAPRDRLVAEGKLLAELNHANLARVVDLDFDGDRPFLVMEYVRGRTLRQHAGGRCLPPREAATLVAQVARALAPAHAVGIIHHDIKPENILIDETGRPRLIDFGMALLRGAWKVEPGEPGVIGGSIPYMAPEQARAEHARVDTHSDLFSLGAVLYELLTGQPPFVGESIDQALTKAQECQFDRAALTIAKVPHQLAAICLQAMSAEPRERQASAELLASELERFARPKSTPWLPLLAAAVVLLAVLIGGYFAFQPPPTRPLAPLQDLVEVIREDDIPKPLRTTQSPQSSDKIRIRCVVPPGWQASIFWLDSTGQLSLLPADDIEQSPTPAGIEYRYPRTQTVELVGAAGTEVVLVCAAPTKAPDLATVESALRELGLLAAWPHLPVNSLVFMNQDQVAIRASELIGKPLGGPEASATADIEHKLDLLRQRLAQDFPFLAALALPHVD